MKQIFKNLDKEILTILQAISLAGGTGYLVGGCVRDQYFDDESKDIDIEVFGLTQVQLGSVLKPFGRVDNVGQSFGVTKLTTKANDYDFNLPRNESKIGAGHKGFEIVVDPFMSVYEAGLRRDVTMNAIYYNPLTKETIDNFGGVSDIETGVLKHVSPKFAEDPLRVERLMQFAGRKQMFIHKETAEMCRSLIPEFGTISKERHWIEFEKLMTKGIAIEEGLAVLTWTGWVANYPQLDALNLHLNGKFAYVGQRCNRAKMLSDNQNLPHVDSLAVRFAALCFDMKSPLEFLKQIDAPVKIQKKVSELCSLVHTLSLNKLSLYAGKVIMASKRNTTKQMVTMLLECLFYEKEEAIYADIGRLIQRFSEEDLKPRVTGQDLIERGWKPSKEFGEELGRLFDDQLRTNMSREVLLSNISKP